MVVLLGAFFDHVWGLELELLEGREVVASLFEAAKLNVRNTFEDGDI